MALLRFGNGAASFIDRGVIEGDGPDRIALLALRELLTQANRPLACRRIDGAVPDVDFAKAVVVDHSDASALNRFFEALPIPYVADTHNGIPPVPSGLFFQSLHQDLVGRATHRISFTPVQMVDPSTGHTTKPATGLDEDDLGPLFLRSQRCHHAASCAAIHADICLVTRILSSLTVLPDQ